jgi:hypothetical protein
MTGLKLTPVVKIDEGRCIENLSRRVDCIEKELVQRLGRLEFWNSVFVLIFVGLMVKDMFQE